MKCTICNKEDELRPYGPNGSMICFDCAMKPERKTETEKNFVSQLEACGSIAMIGTEAGPIPLGKKLS